MSCTQLNLSAEPSLDSPRMLVGMSGWMDGGDVSTGTIDWLISNLNAEILGEIAPEDFYLYAFPGSMEVSALFRPYCRIRDGEVVRLRPPSSRFFFDDQRGLILFTGKEPHMRWANFADCIFEVAERFGVEQVFFLGSVAGVVPHTREPRIFSSVSDAGLKGELESLGVRFSDYQGPASISTYMTHEAPRRGLAMATLVAEIPAYIQGRNPRCIETMARLLAGMLDLPVPIEDLRALSDSFEEKVGEAIDGREDLLQLIDKLESDYDSEIFDTQMGDLKQWLEARGIRLD